MQGFKDKMSKILKQKNITNLIILLLLVIMFYLVVSYFTGVNNITKSEKTNLEKVSKEDMNSNSQKDSEVLSQEKQEKDLERILGKINGCLLYTSDAADDPEIV